MTYPTHLLPTTVVGSYPQPDWLVNRAALEKHGVPRTHAQDIWRIPAELLEQAQDDGTILAIRDMERAGIDIITDGEIRRESYSNRFALALDGIDAEHPGEVRSQTGRTTPVPRVVGRISRRGPVELRDVEFLLRQTDRATKITLPGPFTLSQQAKNEFYADEEEMAMDYAAAVNAELRDLKASGVDVVQLDEPWVRTAPDKAERYGVRAINRALEGIDRPDRGASLLRLRPRGAEQAERLRLSAAARRYGRAADLDRGGTAEARSRRAGRSVGQADHAGRSRPWQRGGGDGGTGRRAHPRRAAPCRRGPADPGARLRHEVHAARTCLRQAARAG